MHDLKLIILLKTLNIEEFRRLGKFLNSPFFNYSKPPVLLYESLRQHFPAFDSPKLTQQNIWGKVFPNKPFNSNKFWQLTSKMATLIERFLIKIELESQPKEEQRLLVQALGSRNKNLFKKELKEFEKELEEKKDGENSYIKEKFLHLQSISNYHGFFSITEAIEYEEETLKSLESFYVTQKLKIATSLKSVEKHRNLSYAFYSIDEIKKLIDTNLFNNSPYVKILSNLFQLMNEGDSKLYPIVKKDFFNLKDSALYNKEDKKFILYHLLNYSINQSNKGNNKFKIEIFNLYKDCLDLGLLLENGRMTKDTFVNIVLYGASLEKLEWTENFIEQYSPNLDHAFKEDCQVLGKGYLSFFKKEYSLTIDQIINYQFLKRREMLRAKGLLIRSYFELFLMDRSYFDLFISYSNSFEKYLTRNEVESKSRLSLYIKFIKILRKLVTSINQNKFNKAFKENFLKSISSEEFNLKQWFIQRLESL